MASNQLHFLWAVYKYLVYNIVQGNLVYVFQAVNLVNKLANNGGTKLLVSGDTSGTYLSLNRFSKNWGMILNVFLFHIISHSFFTWLLMPFTTGINANLILFLFEDFVGVSSCRVINKIKLGERGVWGQQPTFNNATAG